MAEGWGWGRSRGQGEERDRGGGEGGEVGEKREMETSAGRSWGGGRGGKKGAEGEPTLWGRQVDTDPGGCQGGGFSG